MGAQSDSNIYFYKPTFGAALLFCILYTIPTVILFWLTCFKHKTLYLLCIPIAGVFEIAGYVSRCYSVKHDTDVTSYALSSSLIVLAPLLVAAGNYICLGRLIICALPCDSQRLFNLNPRFITKVFVTSDVLSFLVQASGSGVASSQNWTGKAGIDMLLAGLALQLTTNVVFMTLLAAFLKRAAFDKLVRDNAPNSWNLVAKAIVISIILIFIRSVYRLIEFALGFHGYPFTHEWVFFTFEALPMFPAISISCFWYPGKYLPRKKRPTSEDNLQLRDTKSHSQV